MPATKPTVLIVTSDSAWGATCAQAFRLRGCTVDNAASGSAALSFLQKGVYDYVAVDDSLSDFDPIEFGLNMRETAPNRPELLVGLHRLSALERISEPCNIVYVGPRENVLTAIPDVLGEGEEESASEINSARKRLC